MIKTDIQIRFSDVDMLQHVNNIVLQEYYDLGKVDYFQRVMKLPPLWDKIAFIAVNTNTNYYEEVRVENNFYVTTYVSKLGRKSLTFVQEIVERDTSKVKSRSESVLVAFDLERREGIEVAQHFRDLLIAYEENLEV